MTAKTTATAKWKTENGISETATPHRVSLRETILSRKGRGNDHDKDSACHSAWSKSASAESMGAVFLFVVVIGRGKDTATTNRKKILRDSARVASLSHNDRHDI
jgi:hypothetical protein